MSAIHFRVGAPAIHIRREGETEFRNIFPTSGGIKTEEDSEGLFLYFKKIATLDEMAEKISINESVDLKLFLPPWASTKKQEVKTIRNARLVSKKYSISKTEAEIWELKFAFMKEELISEEFDWSDPSPRTISKATIDPDNGPAFEISV